MKQICIILFSLIFINSYSQIDSVLASQIDSMTLLDQEYRACWRMYMNKEIDSITYINTKQRIGNIDSLNYSTLVYIFDKYGYPGYNMVGKESSHNFWLLIQHQDFKPEFQAKVLEKMKVEADKNNSSLLNYAYLIDRVKVNSGELQVYGTQMKINDEGTSYVPKPVVDIDNLNKRRFEVGLTSIEEYIDLMNSRYYGTLIK